MADDSKEPEVEITLVDTGKTETQMSITIKIGIPHNLSETGKLVMKATSLADVVQSISKKMDEEPD